MFSIGKHPVPSNEKIEEMFDAKDRACESIEIFSKVIRDAFKKIKKTSPLSVLSSSKICELNNDRDIRLIKQAIHAFLDETETLGLTIPQSILHERTAPILSHIHGLIVKHWRGGRKRKTKRRLHFNIHTSKNHFMV